MNEDEKTARPRGTDSARVITVIETTALEGRGTEDDPEREITEYWSLQGEKLAINDPYFGSMERASSKASSASM